MHSIVGSADGGVMLSEAEYAAFRARAIEARKNRIYVCWRNMSTGMDCKNIGPESKYARMSAHLMPSLARL